MNFFRVCFYKQKKIKNFRVLVYFFKRHDPIAEENIDPHGRPATDEFEEWSEEVSERTDTGYKDQKIKSAKEREKRIREMDEIIKKDLKE